LVETIKKVDQRIVTVFGGHHSQIFAKEILEKAKDVDFIVLGEGEECLQELATELEKNQAADFEAIKGLVYRSNGNKIAFNESRPLINDLDALPYAASCYSYIEKKLVKVPTVGIMASRGCPYNCNYCATNNMWQRRVRRRSPQNVIGEIKVILATQKEKFLSFYDDCFTLDKKWLLEFCNIMIKDKIKVNWQCITSANLLDPSIFKVLIQAGCRKINIGVESGSERILKLANRKVDLNIAKEVFKLAKKYNISTTAYIMIGFPSETEFDIRLTQKAIRELQPNWVYCNVLVPLPGTVFYNRCLEHKLIDPTNAWRGDSIKNIIMNFTNTIPDDLFFNLVDETFQLCYKINSSIINIIKRAPIRQY